MRIIQILTITFYATYSRKLVILFLQVLISNFLTNYFPTYINIEQLKCEKLWK